MKHTALTLMILALFTLGSFAQAPEGINYQAVARDASGNAMSQEAITVRIGIFKGVGGTTKEYGETHNVTTNKFGLFTFVIGSGTATFGKFSSTDWGTNEHHLKLEVNTGTGYIDMGTSELQSVPYSLYSNRAGKAEQELWTETGSDIYFNNGKVGIGTNSPNSNLHLKATTVGITNGIQMTSSQVSTEDWYIFMPSSDNLVIRDDALDVVTFQNATGNVGINVINPLAKLHVAGGKDVLFGNDTAGSSSRLMWIADKGAFRAGSPSASSWNALNIGSGSAAFGSNTTASGSNSAAFGLNTTASGTNSFALGGISNASGNGAISMGAVCAASGDYSFAAGSANIASGAYSTAIGNGLTSKSGYEVVIGRFNTNYTPDLATGWDSDDRLFVIGNGFASGSRSDAMVVRKSGNVGIGTSNPGHKLSIAVTTNTTPNGDGIGIVNGNTYWNLHMSSTFLRFSLNNGNVSYIDNIGAYLQASDKRLKENIHSPGNLLDRITDLNVVQYNYIRDESKTPVIGLLAQEVFPLFPEIVNRDEGEEYYGLNYSGLGVIAIKGIQEQQVTIEQQDQKIKDLEQRLLEMETRMLHLERN